MSTPVSQAGRRHRLLAVVFGLLVLLGLEGLLRLSGYGGPGDRPDPFGGFASHEPFLVRQRDASGADVWKVRAARQGAFNPISFPASKSSETIRIFCLGGSSTFGFPLDAAHAFCADLDRALTAAHPERRFEVLNCGAMSYGSRRVLNVLREVVNHDPDGLVVYMGHNEYVERRFFARFLEEAGWRRRLRATLNRWRLYLALRRGLARLTPGPAAAAGSGDLFGVGPVRDDSRRLSRSLAEDRLVAEQFRFALDEMAAVAERAGVPLLLVKPASNLRDWAPEASDWTEDLPAAQRRARDTAYAEARAAWQRDDASATLAAADAVLHLDPLPAQAHYLRGRALLAAGRREEALAALRTARDRDAVPIRMPGFLGQEIRAAWKRHRLPELDGEAALASASPDGIVGDGMVLDYCHPTPTGHHRLAALVWPALHAALWPGEPVPPPGTALDQVEGEDNAEIYTSGFGAAWTGQMMLRQGKVERAEALFRRAVALEPALATAHEGLGRVLAMRGSWGEATAELELATRLAPEVANGWNNLGSVYLATGRVQEAARAFQQALKGGVGEALVRRNLAGALLQLGRLQEARREIEAALRQSPADAGAWLRLGEIATAQGDEGAARRAYRQALDLDPGLAAAHQGLGDLP